MFFSDRKNVHVPMTNQHCPILIYLSGKLISPLLEEWHIMLKPTYFSFGKEARANLGCVD